MITLRNQSQPISLVDLHNIKRSLKPSPFLINLGKFFKVQFKNTAFYDFFLIASSDLK